MVQEAQAAIGDVPAPEQSTSDFVLGPWYHVADRVIKMIGVVAKFDATAEVTPNELRIELAYPLDRTSEELFRFESGPDERHEA